MSKQHTCVHGHDSKHYYQKKDGSWRCRSCHNASSLKSYKGTIAKDEKKTRKRLKKNALRSRFGISEEVYEWMLQVQGEKCAICKRPAADTYYGTLSVDHDHRTNVVRGLLCQPCNLGLGQFADNATILDEAAAYVRRFKLHGG
jgi:hypothetical protein